jgi:hypothetical protein
MPNTWNYRTFLQSPVSAYSAPTVDLRARPQIPLPGPPPVDKHPSQKAIWNKDGMPNSLVQIFTGAGRGPVQT